MSETYKELEPFLPAELTGCLNELYRRVQSESKEAWEFLKDNPEAEGLPVTNFRDWMEASACVTLIQHMQDGKIETMNEQDGQEIQRLFDVANGVISDFVKKYQDPTSIMRPQNFVKNYLETATVKLSTIDPLSRCFSLDFDPIGTESEINVAFDTPDWLSICEIDPEYYESIKGNTAKAAYWFRNDRPNLIVIPIEVVCDFFVLKRIAEKAASLQKDIMFLLDSNGSMKTLSILDTFLQETVHDFASRAMRYETTIVHTDMHLAALQIVNDYSGRPNEIIELFGPGCFCVPWLTGQESEQPSN